MAQVQKLSQAAFDRLNEEYSLLTTTGRIDIARKIETARELGDLSENGDYHAAKEEQGKMEGRIAHISSILENAEIVAETTSGGMVREGSVVSIQYVGDDELERYLVGSIEERIEDAEVVSPTSPLGEALLGSKVGEVIKFSAPGGLLEVEIVEID
ncbi:MAG: transcription elongation factor GreA [Acidimicrobiaceae bacterium]|jgi:transcription elongation factor GreA|nr:transcription elongation factor GreA [Acidimicrobiaceae bacterium]|tara:strand:- start:70077 stop:70544 length:468 start_codon:yes stop_codon:yes gene_type:complete